MKKENNKKLFKTGKEKEYIAFKKKVRNISLYFLENILDNVEDLSALAVDRKAVYRAFNQNKTYEWRDSIIGKWLHNLKQRDLIKIEKIDRGESIILTDKAKMKIVEKITSKMQSDKIKRFVSFDIPESLCNNRNRFRSIIKKMGFVKIQQSLWVIDKDVTDLLQTAMYDCKVEKYVAYIVSAKTDIDGVIERKLGRQ